MCAEYGLRPRRNWIDVGGSASPARLVAVTVSPALCLPPPDWPAIVRETSFLFWDRPPEWQMPQELDVFSVASDPVVCLSFGSMSLDLGHGFDALYR